MTIKKVVQRFEITDDANFIRINGKIYSLNDVGESSLGEVIESTKKYFENQANEHNQLITDDVVELARTQEHEQLDHLREAQASNVCAVNEGDWQKPLVAFCKGANGYSSIRFTVWNPRIMYFGAIGLANLAHTIKEEFRFNNNRRSLLEECYDPRISKGLPENFFIRTPFHADWKKMCEDIACNSYSYKIICDQFIPPQIIMTYFDGFGIKFIPLLSVFERVHPHELSSRSLCTGGVENKKYWNNPQYHTMLQDINFESLATREFDYVDKHGEVSSWELYFMLNQINIKSIAKEEASSWRTKRTS